MAELNTNTGNGRNRAGRRSRSQVSTRVDMTPMVDLAFLLITFFMLTTSFLKMKTIEVNMPDKSENNQRQDIKESNALTLILDESDKVYYYSGLDKENKKLTDNSPTGIRQIILQKKAENPDLIIIIKATEKCKYNNFVEILDEMHVNKIARYAITEFDKQDDLN